mmetsp:Transcript_104089/g.289999  ORF Transcript_104089/g.289999 Transcript_104089/m.289999 type:complete len:231 (-) Transcript_104089:225-917(-)
MITPPERRTPSQRVRAMLAHGTSRSGRDCTTVQRVVMVASPATAGSMEEMCLLFTPPRPAGFSRPASAGPGPSGACSAGSPSALSWPPSAAVRRLTVPCRAEPLPRGRPPSARRYLGATGLLSALLRFASSGWPAVRGPAEACSGSSTARVPPPLAAGCCPSAPRHAKLLPHDCPYNASRNLITSSFDAPASNSAKQRRQIRSASALLPAPFCVVWKPTLLPLVHLKVNV